MTNLLPLLFLFSCKTIKLDCPMIGISYEDRYTQDSTLLRTWTIVDWCKYNPKTGKGLFQFTEEIRYEYVCPINKKP